MAKRRYNSALESNNSNHVVSVRLDPATEQLFYRKMGSLVLRSRKRASDLVRRTSLVVETQAAELAPVDTGRLRQSIRRIPRTDLEVLVYTNVHYARYQEEGTETMRGKWYMRRGYQRGVAYMARELKNFF